MAPVIPRRPKGRRNSISTSPPSSKTDPRVYTGPDYRTAIAGGFGPPDPLLHPDPNAPTRLYRFVVALLRLLVPILFRLRVEGLENLPSPPYILASNHQRWFDSAIILAALPPGPVVYSMARRDTVFNAGWKRAIVRRLGVFAIMPSQGEVDVSGVASTYRILNRGGIVLIFPEGRYSRGGALRPLKKGVGHFALQAGVPVVPLVLRGVDTLHLFGRVSVTIEPAILPNPPAWWEPSRRILAVVEQVRQSFQRVFERTRQRKPKEDRLWHRARRRLNRLLPARASAEGHPTEPPRPGGGTKDSF